MLWLVAIDGYTTSDGLYAPRAHLVLLCILQNSQTVSNILLTPTFTCGMDVG